MASTRSATTSFQNGHEAEPRILEAEQGRTAEVLVEQGPGPAAQVMELAPKAESGRPGRLEGRGDLHHRGASLDQDSTR